MYSYVGAAPAVVALPIEIPGLGDDGQGNPYPLPAVMVEASMPNQTRTLIVWTFHSLRHGEQAKNIDKLNNMMAVIKPWPQASASVQHVIDMLYADF